jgi:hypothetical protein
MSEGAASGFGKLFVGKRSAEMSTAMVRSLGATDSRMQHRRLSTRRVLPAMLRRYLGRPSMWSCLWVMMWSRLWWNPSVRSHQSL